jgi:hypothetical protein
MISITNAEGDGIAVVDVAEVKLVVEVPGVPDVREVVPLKLDVIWLPDDVEVIEDVCEWAVVVVAESLEEGLSFELLDEMVVKVDCTVVVKDDRLVEEALDKDSVIVVVVLDPIMPFEAVEVLAGNEVDSVLLLMLLLPADVKLETLVADAPIVVDVPVVPSELVDVLTVLVDGPAVEANMLVEVVVESERTYWTRNTGLAHVPGSTYAVKA